MKNNKKLIGTRINTALADRKITQKELADYLEVKPNVISYFCSGERTPNTEQIIMIAEYLNISTDYLLGRTKSQSIKDKMRAAVDVTGLSDEAINKLVSLKQENIVTSYSDILSMFLEFGNTEYILSLIGAKISYYAAKKGLKNLELINNMIDRTISIDIDGLNVTAYKDNLIEAITQSELINSINIVSNEYMQRYSKTPAECINDFKEYKNHADKKLKNGEITIEEYSDLIEQYYNGGASNGKYKEKHKL